MTLINCTLTKNIAGISGGAVYNNDSEPLIVNTILWGNLPEEIVNDATSSTTVTYSDIQNGFAGNDNIDIDPLFVDPDENDLHIKTNSPCIEAGDDSAVVTIPNDYDGEPRQAGIVDIGADEFVDIDNDNIPDYWEKEYWPDDWDGDNSEDDPDGDGINNGDEYQQNLDPTVNEIPMAAIKKPVQTIEEDVEIILDSSDSSDSDDGIIKWLWEQIAEPGDRILDIINADQEMASFTTPQVEQGGESFEFRLTVFDKADQASLPKTCIVNVTWGNSPPVSDAGPDMVVNGGDMVQLDGSASVDRDGEIVSYIWEQTEGADVDLSDPSTVNPVFTAPYASEEQTLGFKLTVTDQKGLQYADLVTITVNATNSGAAAGIDIHGSSNGDVFEYIFDPAEKLGCFIQTISDF